MLTTVLLVCFSMKGKDYIRVGIVVGAMATEYEKLVASAEALVAERALEFLTAKQKAEFERKNLDKAFRLCSKAIEIDASLPAAHLELGIILEAQTGLTKAAESFLTAMQCAEVDPSESGAKVWARSAAHAYAVLSRLPDEKRPAWWEAHELLSRSERVVTLLPEESLAHKWRGEALSGFQDAVPMGADLPRAQSLREAAAHFQRVVALSTSAEEKKAAALASADCLMKAARFESQAGKPADSDGEVATAGGGGGKNANKNKKKKEKAKIKLAEQLLSEVTDPVAKEGGKTTADAGGSSSMGGEPDGTELAYSANYEAPSAISGAISGGAAAAAESETGYVWADPLPEDFVDALAEIGISAGSPVTAVDMVGIDAQGGAAVSEEVGLIRRVQPLTSGVPATQLALGATAPAVDVS